MKHGDNIVALTNLLPDYMGFIFYDQSPRFVNNVDAGLIKNVPSSIKTTGVFVNENLEHIINTTTKYQLKAVQLHGSETPEHCFRLKQQGVELIKAFGIHEAFNFSSLQAYENVVDFFLFDTQTVVHGGSGKVFNWELLNRYELQVPYFLSGGIDTVHLSALKQIKDPRLYAVDVNSKFELEPGFKDIQKLKRFIEVLYHKR